MWHGDSNFRAASDYASLGWFTSFAIICLLGLVGLLHLLLLLI